MSTGHDQALWAVHVGLLRVDADGSIWRIAKFTPYGRKMSILPKRAECRLKNGYLGVTVWRDNKQYLVLAHRLVWSVSKGPIPPNHDINHKNGAKADNRPENLEPTSRGDNLRHAARTGLRVYKKLDPTTAARAAELRATGISYAAVAKTLGISQTFAFRYSRK